MSHYNTCPHCGANLDSGESCDCAGARYERLTPENRVKFDLFVAELMKKQNAAPSAANTEDGKAEKVLTGSDSASIVNENGGLVK